MSKDTKQSAVVRELLNLRKLYDQYESKHTVDFEGNAIATWSGYKWFRNPISDRIEGITGVRSDKDVEAWLEARDHPSPAQPDELREAIWKKLEWYFGGERQNMRIASKELTTMFKAAQSRLIDEIEAEMPEKRDDGGDMQTTTMYGIENSSTATPTLCMVCSFKLFRCYRCGDDRSKDLMNRPTKPEVSESEE